MSEAYLTLKEAAARLGYRDAAALRQAALRWQATGGAAGLRAVKLGRDWVTTAAWLADYRARKRSHKGRP